MIRVADLFAGAGGASTGLRLACQQLGTPLELVAVNHWPIAIETHSRNHPGVRHFCAPVESLDPRVAVPGGKLDLLIAAPECTHHSTARGGKPINDQSRASAWHILRWLELLRVDAVLIENVPEFRTWGPLGVNNRPLKSKKGAIFEQFLKALEGYGFRVEYRILNAADYGEATTRRRLFIQARRRGPITWPAPTHSRHGVKTLLRGTCRWRAAREVIDWTIPGESIFSRKKPLAPATMRRIVEGLKRFGGPALQPFLVVLRQHMDSRSLDEPLQALTASGTHVGVAQPFLIPYYGERDGQAPRNHAIDEPLPTIPTNPKFGLVEPFVISAGGAPLRKARGTSEPLPTVMGSDRLALVEPFLLGQHGGATARPVSEPAPTVTVTTRDRFALVEPRIDGPGPMLGRPSHEAVSLWVQPAGETRPQPLGDAAVRPHLEARGELPEGPPDLRLPPPRAALPGSGPSARRRARGAIGRAHHARDAARALSGRGAPDLGSGAHGPVPREETRGRRMMAEAFGPAIGLIEQQLSEIETQLAEIRTKRDTLAEGLATMRRLAGHPDPHVGLLPASAVIPAPAPVVCDAAAPSTVQTSRPAPSRAPRAAERSAPDRFAALEAAVLRAIAGGATKARDIRRACWVTDRVRVADNYRPVMERLVAAGRVIVDGRRSAATYRLPGQAAAPAAKEAQSRGRR